MSEINTHLLVVGGGFAGRTAARHAASKGVPVLLVDPQVYFEFTPSVPRCLVCPSAIRNATRPHELPGSGLAERGVRFCCGTVTELDNTSAKVNVRPQEDAADGSGNDAPPPAQLVVHFKCCVWAGGSGYASPVRASFASGASVQARQTEFQGWLENMTSAQRILILGGGLVGVEIAAEIATRLPPYRASAEGTPSKRTITLASSSTRLLPRLPPRAGRLAERFLSKRGVSIVQRRLEEEKEVKEVEESAQSGSARQRVFVDHAEPSARFAADVVLDCRGPAREGSEASALLRAAPLAAAGSGRSRRARVDATLQLGGMGGVVFVAGDACEVDGELDAAQWGGEKTAYAAAESGRIAAENAVRRMRDPELELLEYPRDAFGKTFPRLFLVGLGKWHGLMCMGPMVIGGPIAAGGKVCVEQIGVRALTTRGFVAKVWDFMEGFAFRSTKMVTAVAKMAPGKKRNRMATDAA